MNGLKLTFIKKFEVPTLPKLARFNIGKMKSIVFIPDRIQNRYYKFI